MFILLNKQYTNRTTVHIIAIIGALVESVFSEMTSERPAAQQSREADMAEEKDQKLMDQVRAIVMWKVRLIDVIQHRKQRFRPRPTALHRHA